MDNPTPKSALELVKEFYATGYYGHDQWIQSLETNLGEAVVASRQLESAVARVASSWVDGKMSDHELFDFLGSSLQQCVTDFAEVLQTSSRRMDNSNFSNITETICVFLTDMRLFREKKKWNFGQIAVAALVAAMVIRQILEDYCNGGDSSKKFDTSSSCVAEIFFTTCLKKLSAPTISLKPGLSLDVVAERVMEALLA